MRIKKQKARHKERAKLAEKSKIIFPYGTDLLRSKQIKPQQILKVCWGLLFDKLEFE